MELDARNGVIVRLGRRHGIATPFSEMTVALLAAMARKMEGRCRPPGRGPPPRRCDASLKGDTIKGSAERQGRDGNPMKSEWIATRAKRPHFDPDKKPAPAWSGFFNGKVGR
jgi:hypothetical protein